jgi:hypothetical protein
MIFNCGDTRALAGTTAITIPTLAGEVIADELVPFADTESPRRGEPIAAKGTVQIRVVRTDLGTLDFYCRISALTGRFPVHQIEWNWEGPPGPLHADYALDGLGHASPSSASRGCAPSATPGHELTALTFTFPDRSFPAPTRFLNFRTDARDFQRGPALTLVGPAAAISDPTDPIGYDEWGVTGVDAFVPRY